jgi:hypothetical protein
MRRASVSVASNIAEGAGRGEGIQAVSAYGPRIELRAANAVAYLIKAQNSKSGTVIQSE